MCRCPAHEDDSASLSVAEGTVKAVVVHCHAGCSFQAVAEAAVDRGVPRAALSRRKAAQVTLYRYHDESGAYVFTKRRGADKRFSVGVEKDGQWQGKLQLPRSALRPLYRLPELLGADPDLPVFIC